MTIEEAREVLQEQIDKYGQEYDTEAIDALEVAIQALSSWEKYSDELWKKAYARGCNDVLDKIRAEIDDEADFAYCSFNVYKEEILHAEPDELPNDDFRWGLRRAIDIIDKYMEESEGAE